MPRICAAGVFAHLSRRRVRRLARLEAVVRQREELAEGLALIDFEQLKIENQARPALSSADLLMCVKWEPTEPGKQLDLWVYC